MNWKEMNLKAEAAKDNQDLMCAECNTLVSEEEILVYHAPDGFYYYFCPHCTAQEKFTSVDPED